MRGCSVDGDTLLLPGATFPSTLGDCEEGDDADEVAVRRPLGDAAAAPKVGDMLPDPKPFAKGAGDAEAEEALFATSPDKPVAVAADPDESAYEGRPRPILPCSEVVWTDSFERR